MEEILVRIMFFQILSDILSIILGTGLVFGALKWSKGLISITALYWGAFLGLILGYMFFSDNFELILYTVIIGAILLPILTYTVAGINRFILGFIVTNKFMFFFFCFFVFLFSILIFKYIKTLGTLPRIPAGRRWRGRERREERGGGKEEEKYRLFCCSVSLAARLR